MVNDVVTKNFRRAASRNEKGCEHLDCRGFTGAIRTEQTEEFTPINVKGYAINGDYFFYLPTDNTDGCLKDSSQVSYFDRVQYLPLWIGLRMFKILDLVCQVSMIIQTLQALSYLWLQISP